MVNGNKQKWLILFLGICLFGLFAFNGMALVKGNDSDQAFVTGDTGGDSGNRLVESNLVTGPSLRDYLIDGAANFLDSYSHTLAFLKEIELGELQGLDFIALNSLVDKAISVMEASSLSYANLRQLAYNTPYNEDMIRELMTFNYTAYLKSNDLNRIVFKEVQFYLQHGDVRGAYDKMWLDTIYILDVLHGIKSTISSNTMPEGAPLWKLNQYYSESLLFGQYMAGIFSEILKTF
jgi:hypothetical protein